MGQDARFEVKDARRRYFYWIGNDTLDEYMAKVGASAWAVYSALCREAGPSHDNVQLAHSQLAKKTGLSSVTVMKGIAVLEEQGLLATRRNFSEAGTQQPNTYTLLEPVLTGQQAKEPVVQATETTELEMLWAHHPDEAAIKELATAKNKLAVVSRLYAMRFNTSVWPFSFPRMGKLAKTCSGGEVAMIRFIWGCASDNVRGDPMDYITKALWNKTTPVAPAAPVDPQVAAREKLRHG